MFDPTGRQSPIFDVPCAMGPSALEPSLQPEPPIVEEKKENKGFFRRLEDVDEETAAKPDGSKIEGGRYAGYPRASSSELLIHIDTSLILTAKRIQAVVASSGHKVEDQKLVPDERILLINSEGLVVLLAVGLDTDPHEISIFEVGLASGSVKFGLCATPLEK